MKFITIILFYLCLCTICDAQVKCIGSVKLHNGSPVESAIIIAKIPSKKENVLLPIQEPMNKDTMLLHFQIAVRKLFYIFPTSISNPFERK